MSEKAREVIHAAPEWIVRQIGGFGPVLLSFVGIIFARASAGDERTSALGMIVAAVLTGVAVAMAYSQGQDRGEAKRVTATTINLKLGKCCGLAEDDA